jgi:hypothetical protein
VRKATDPSNDSYGQVLDHVERDLERLLAPDGWNVELLYLGESDSTSGPPSIRFTHPLSMIFDYGLGAAPRGLAEITAELRRFVGSEREFVVVRQAPRAPRHETLLRMLRCSAFAYRWNSSVIQQVAEAMQGGEALDEEEAVWFAYAGAAVWGHPPGWPGYKPYQA